MSPRAPSATDRPMRRRGWHSLAAFGGLLALALWVHWGLWRNLWYQDDWLWLRIARDIAHSPSFLFTPDPHNSEAVLRLTQRVVMALTYAGAGLNASVYHVVSIVLHALAATAVFRLLWALVRRFAPTAQPLPWAALGAVLYVASSSHAMAVQWMAAQSTLLSTLVGTVLLTVWIERERRLSEPTTWVATIGLLLLALWSKNTLATLPLALAAAIVLVPFDHPRPAWKLCGVLAVVAAAHIVLTKLLLPALWSQTGAVTDQGQFGLSVDTVNNVLGAIWGSFVSAKAYAAWGAPIPFQLAAVGLVAIALLVGRAVGVLRPVALALVWIVVLSIPTALLDYRQYDPTHLTVNRYQHLPMVAAATMMTFLALGAWRALGRRQVVSVALAVLVVLHVGWDRTLVQRDQQRLRKWGEVEQRFLDRILQRAEASMPKGTTIFAVGWQTGDAYLACMNDLFFVERGYTLAGQRAYEEFVAQGPRNRQPIPWVGFYDDTRKQFGILPLPVFLNQELQGGSS